MTRGRSYAAVWGLPGSESRMSGLTKSEAEDLIRFLKKRNRKRGKYGLRYDVRLAKLSAGKVRR